MKIALINAGDLVALGYSPSLGIGYIKSFLIKNSQFKVKILRKNIYYSIIKEKFDIVGINSNSSNYQDAINFASLLKRSLKNVIVILGGVHITALPKSLDPIFDIGVIGEGEETMLEVVSLIKRELRGKSKELNKVKLKNIKGICFFDNKNKLIINPRRELIQDLDSLPHIDRSDFDDENYHYILTSRGCFFNCLFCAADKIWQSKRVHYFSAKYIYQEIKSMSKAGLKTINISDDMFLSDIKRLGELANYIKKDKSLYKKLDLAITVKADFITDEVGLLLSEIGCKTIKTGIESTSEVLYRKFRNSDFQLFIKALSIIKKYRINLSLNLNLNNPWQNNYEYFKICNFLEKNNISNINIFLAEPYPGTYYWDYALNEKIIDSNFNLSRLNIIGHKAVNDISQNDIVPFSNEISPSDMVSWIKKIDLLVKRKKRNLFKSIIRRVIKVSNKIYKNINVFTNSNSNFPETVRWIITKKCNLNCKMCLNKKMRMDSQMKDVEYLKIQDQFLEISKHKTQLVLYGGEPTMNRDLLYLVRSAFLNKIHTTCYTNLVDSSTSMNDYVFFGLKNFYISLDSFDSKIHDNIRNSIGCFDKTMMNISCLTDLKKTVSQNIKITIATVIVEDNYDSLSKMYDFIESLGGVDYWNLRHNTFFHKDKLFFLKSDDKYHIKDLNGQMIDREHFFNKNDLEVLKYELDSINKKSKKYLTRLDIKTDISKNLLDYYYKKSFSKGNCGNFLKNNVKILGNDVQTDCGYSIGQIGEKMSLEQIWNSKKNRSFQEYVKKNKIPQCFRCARIEYKF